MTPANVIRLSERRGGALTMLDALTRWHEQDEDARPLTGPLAESFMAGFRGDETPPLVRAFLDGELARMLGDLGEMG